MFVEISTFGTLSLATLKGPYHVCISLEPHGEPAGRAELRVPGLGDYRLRAVLLRDEDGYEDVVDVTPTSLSPITINVAEVEVRVDFDATVVDAALAKLRAVRR